jgi:hypothetical protein
MKDRWNKVKISHSTKLGVGDFHYTLKTSYLKGIKEQVGTPSMIQIDLLQHAIRSPSIQVLRSDQALLICGRHIENNSSIGDSHEQNHPQAILTLRQRSVSLEA